MTDFIGYVVIAGGKYYNGRGYTREGQKQVWYNEFEDSLELAYVFKQPGTAVRKAQECNGAARVVALDTDTYKRVLMDGEVKPICEKKGVK